MKYNFDEEICREGTSCEKFDLRDEIFGRDDVIPLWVADMDFAAPPEVTEAIRKRAEHPVLGYSYRSDAYWNAIIGWVERHGGWKLRRECSTSRRGSYRGSFSRSGHSHRKETES